MKKLFTIFLIGLAAPALLYAQDAFKPDMSRLYFHYQIDKAQKKLLAKDGKADDTLVIVNPDNEFNPRLTLQIKQGIDELQMLVESSASIDNQQKPFCLKGITALLDNAAAAIANGTLAWHQLPALLELYSSMMKEHAAGASILATAKTASLPVARAIAATASFSGNADDMAFKEWVFFKTIDQKPDQLLRELSKMYDYPFADSMIAVSARQMPEQLFNYAQASRTPFAQKIAEVGEKDSLVKTVVQLSRQSSGQLYLPFLDLLDKKQVSWEQLTAASRNADKYYSLLVKAQLSAARSVAETGKPAIASKGLSAMLKQKSYELYVNSMNGLHDASAAVRFKKIQNLSPTELYYLIVLNEESIYTSSYLYVYRRIFDRMQVKTADSLLQMVGYDRYKKFITMASNYNTLDGFLARMDTLRADSLMRQFVSGLDKGQNQNDVEDAVDVANAYASITNPAIRQLMQQQVDANLQIARQAGDKRATDIYHIEKLLMQSGDTVAHIDLTDSLGIPPVYSVKNDYLRDSAGRITMQMFFLDDGTGKGSFNVLMRLYANRSQWKMESSKYWVKLSSINTPVPFVLFANRALDGETHQDEKAQKETVAFMQDNGFDPSIVVHRGHSFSLQSTINKLPATSKVVVLGSCGAYQNLADILRISPEAYIISSKQTGIGEINIALFQYLVNNLKMGHDIQWPGMMEQIGKLVTRKDGYDDYVFPHRNLGAMFIKAYKIAREKEEVNARL